MASHDDDAVIGRDSELDVVDRFLAAVADGPAAVLLRGEPGIGKSTIWHEAVARAAAASYTVLSSRPSSSEADLPYAGLGDLFARLDDDVMKALPDPQRRALDIALLRADADANPLQQRAVSAAALHVLVHIARSTPVIVAIDDLQWLDSPSVNVLRFVLRRIRPASVGVIVASRSNVVEDDRFGITDSLRSTEIRRLTVGPLELSPLDRMLRSRVGTAFLGPTLRQIHETSGGNPFFAIEIARVLLDPAANTVPGQVLPVPATLPELLAARLAPMPASTRRALVAASAVARPTVDLVLTATEDDGVTRDALDRAVAADIVVVHAGVVRFTHPLLASAVYADASAGVRRVLHQRFAALVRDPEEQARHLGLSTDRPDAGVAARLEYAAHRASSRGAPDAAAALLEQAVELTPMTAPDEVLRRKLDAADQYIAAGVMTRAREILDDLLRAELPGPSRARALHRRARVSTLVSEFLIVPPMLQKALAEVGDDLALRAAIERDLVWSLAQVGEVNDLLPHARAALDAAEASGNAALIAEALSHLCMAQCFSGDDVDRDLLDRAMRLDRQFGVSPPAGHPAIASGRLTLALTLKWTDNFDEARDLLNALHREHVERGDEAALTPVLFHLGELECWSGDWPAAARIANECHDVAVRSDQAVAELRALALDTMVACFRGTADAVATSTNSLALADAAGDWPTIIRILKSLGVHELAIGDVPAAVDHLSRGIAVEKKSGYDHRTVRIVPDAVEALVAAERWEEAVPLVHELEGRGAKSGRAWALATGARCRALLHAAMGDFAAAEQSFEIAMREHDRLPRPFERARTLLCLGVVQRRTRQQRAARSSLDEARRCFETLGAARWADRARDELDRVAGRVSSPLALTPTEEQVAKLVADGRTNNEVAAALFISAKTVEANLTRIYRKLGVTSRRELARQIRGARDLEL